MQLSNEKRTNIILYLKQVTNYPDTYINNLFDVQLYSMYQKFSHRMYKIINEIEVLQEESAYTFNTYTKEELIQKKYDQLVEIKNKYLSTPENEAEMDFILNSAMEEEPEDYEFLTPEETMQMYGSEFTSDDLTKKGIYLDYSSTNQTTEKEESEELKEKLIELLIEAQQRGIIYMPFKKEILESYSLDAIKALYKEHLKEELSYPPLDEIIMQLYLK